MSWIRNFSISLLVILISAGCADLRLAKLAYRQGDFETAKKHWQTLADRGFPQAEFGLGKLAEEVQHAPEQAIQFYLDAYHKGYLPAAYQIGRYYFNHRDWPKAGDWLQKAEAHGSLGARLLLADMKLQGLGMKADPQIAIDTYQQLSRQGLAAATKRLARLYEQGQYAAVDLKKAFAFYQKALDQGDLSSELALARFYAQGLGVEKAPAQAIDLYRRHANAGDISAAYALARFLESESQKADPPQEAVQWYRFAAERNHLPAQLRWAELLLSGTGVPQDTRTALTLLEQLSKQGIAKASRRLGAIYRRGLHVPADFQKAFQYFENARRQGDAAAELQLAELYERGLGVPANPPLAVSIYQRQAGMGNLRAIMALGRIHEQIWQQSHSSESLAKAIQWYRRAASQNLPAAQFKLARLLEASGDQTEAKLWADLALASGDGEALLYFGQQKFQQARETNDKIQALSWVLTAARLKVSSAVATAWYIMQQMDSPEQIDQANRDALEHFRSLQRSAPPP